MSTADDVQFLLAQAKVQLPGASEAEIKAALFDTLREFFIDSSSWTETVQVFIVPETTQYNVTVEDGSTIVRLIGVADPNGIPQAAVMPEIGLIQFALPYSNAATFTAVLAKTVALPRATNGLPPSIPEGVLPIWHSAILDGVLGNLFMQSAKPYYHVQNAKYHLARFRDGISRARVAALRRNAFGTQAWRFPTNFATSTQRGGVSVGNDTRFN